MTSYEEKEVEALASMLIGELDRETVDKFIEDENGNLAGLRPTLSTRWQNPFTREDAEFYPATESREY